MSEHGLSVTHDPTAVLPEQRGATLADALHDLSQPLTSLLFAVEMGRMHRSAEELRLSLDEALKECHRALEAMYRVQEFAQEANDGDTAPHVIC